MEERQRRAEARRQQLQMQMASAGGTAQSPMSMASSVGAAVSGPSDVAPSEVFSLATPEGPSDSHLETHGGSEGTKSGVTGGSHGSGSGGSKTWQTDTEVAESDRSLPRDMSSPDGQGGQWKQEGQEGQQSTQGLTISKPPSPVRDTHGPSSAATDGVNAFCLNGCTALYTAASSGDEAEIRKLLREPDILVDKGDRFTGWSPLMGAASNGHVRCVARLIGRANVQFLSASKHTPLLVALRAARASRDKSGSLEAVLMLLNAGAIPDPSSDVPDPLGAAPGQIIVAAVELLTPETFVKFFPLSVLSKVRLAEVKDLDGTTPAAAAARAGKLAILEHLRSAGASLTLQSRDGRLPIHEAASGGHKECVELLLPESAEALRVTPYDSELSTVLHEAVLSRSVECVQAIMVPAYAELWRHWLDLENAEKMTPAALAAAKGLDNLLLAIITNGALTGARRQGQAGTLLHCIVAAPVLLLRSWLACASAAKGLIDARDGEGRTVLNVACDKGHPKIVKELLSWGVSSLKLPPHQLRWRYSCNSACATWTFARAALLGKALNGTPLDFIQSLQKTMCAGLPLPELAHDTELHLACRRWNHDDARDIMQILCNKLKVKEIFELLERPGSVGLTPLQWIVCRGHTELLQFVLAQVDNPNSQLAIMWGASYGEHSATSLLLIAAPLLDEKEGTSCLEKLFQAAFRCLSHAGFAITLRPAAVMPVQSATPTSVLHALLLLCYRAASYGHLLVKVLEQILDRLRDFLKGIPETDRQALLQGVGLSPRGGRDMPITFSMADLPAADRIREAIVTFQAEQGLDSSHGPRVYAGAWASVLPRSWFSDSPDSFVPSEQEIFTVQTALELLLSSGLGKRVESDRSIIGQSLWLVSEILRSPKAPGAATAGQAAESPGTRPRSPALAQLCALLAHLLSKEAGPEGDPFRLAQPVEKVAWAALHSFCKDALSSLNVNPFRAESGLRIPLLWAERLRTLSESASATGEGVHKAVQGGNIGALYTWASEQLGGGPGSAADIAVREVAAMLEVLQEDCALKATPAWFRPHTVSPHQVTHNHCWNGCGDVIMMPASKDSDASQVQFAAGLMTQELDGPLTGCAYLLQVLTAAVMEEQARLAMKSMEAESDPREFSFTVGVQSATGDLYWTLTLCAPPAAGKPLHKVVHSAYAAEEAGVDRLSLSRNLFKRLHCLLCHGFCVPGVGLQDFLRTDDGQVVFTGFHKVVPFGTCIPPRSTYTAAVSHDFGASSLCDPSDSEWMAYSHEATLAHQAGQAFVVSEKEARVVNDMICAHVAGERVSSATCSDKLSIGYSWGFRAVREGASLTALTSMKDTDVNFPEGPFWSPSEMGLGANYFTVGRWELRDAVAARAPPAKVRGKARSYIGPRGRAYEVAASARPANELGELASSIRSIHRKEYLSSTSAGPAKERGKARSYTGPRGRAYEVAASARPAKELGESVSYYRTASGERATWNPRSRSDGLRRSIQIGSARVGVSTQRSSPAQTADEWLDPSMSIEDLD